MKYIESPKGQEIAIDFTEHIEKTRDELYH
jgi:hypothetical protein